MRDLKPLTVDNLSFRYRGREEWALRDVSFEAGVGEVVLIAGASGSGKTTLIRCLNGLIPRSYKGGEMGGTIRLMGEDPSGLTLAEISHRLGTVLQDPERQIVGSRVANEVAFGLENLGVPRPEMRRRVAAVLEHLGIAALASRETASLSGGEKQKVALAGTLVMEPSILLLDEPLANLDPASAREALELFRRLAGEGRTLLLVEHRVEEVLHIQPEKALFLSAGRQEYFGDLPGFLEAADPRDVKLPAELAVAALRRREGVQVFRCSGVQVRPTTDIGPNAQRSTLIAPPEHLNTRPPEHPPLVEFDRVSFAYDPAAPVLREITLSIQSGDVIAVLGPNGAGKSTLVKHAIGLLKPTSGVVRVEGRDTRERTTAQLAATVGYVFQSPSHMLFAPTVREELAFGPRNLGHAEERVAGNIAAVLAAVDLAGSEERPPLALSFGQQKRVGIAAVLAMESRILVMDEPTAGQDYRHYNEFMRTILGLRIADRGSRIGEYESGESRVAGVGQSAIRNPQSTMRSSAIRNPQLSAVLFITHDLDLAISFASRVWLLADGLVVADGPTEEVLSDPNPLAACRLHRTSLLELNQVLLPRTGRFLPLEGIAALRAAESL